MSTVVLASGGLDSTLVCLLACDDGLDVHPLFLDYGQMCAQQELAACREVHARLGLPEPFVMDLSGYGRAVPSGLTDARLRVNEDAFLPGRNALFLLAGAAYAYRRNADAVAIGLLSERARLFPDQSRAFLARMRALVATAMGRDIRIVAPLINFSKEAVLILAAKRGITGTYSCHAGMWPPCGKCVSCQEALAARGGMLA
jgi:7-cyano-7-deazaguanine synthase